MGSECRFPFSASYLLSLLLELLDGSLVDATALVDQVAGGGRFTRVDVSNDDDVDVGLFLGHLDGLGIVGVRRGSKSETLQLKHTERNLFVNQPSFSYKTLPLKKGDARDDAPRQTIKIAIERNAKQGPMGL